MKDETRSEVERLARIACENAGCELFGVEFTGAGRHSVLRVFVDREEGVRIDDCQAVSHELSVLLDVSDVIAHQYTLEVSSPGLDRPLRGPADFAKYVGRKVKVITARPIGGKSEQAFVGTLVRYEDEIATVRTPRGEVRIPQDAVKRANLEFEAEP
jgi:ribosome maturation factor RimP